MLPAVPATSVLSSDSTDSGNEDGRPHQPHPHDEPFINIAECTSVHEGRQQISTILPVNIDTLFASLYGRSKFLDDFHSSRRITDIEHTEWSLDEQNRRRRRFKCVMPIKASIGPKVSYVTEIQTLRECSVPGNLYSIDITSWNENVPYGDVFTIYVHHCLVRTVDDHTMFSVYVNIKFRKSVFSVIKSLIEKTSYSGIDEFHSDLALQLSRHFCSPPARHKRHIRNRSSVQSPLSDAAIIHAANRASTPPRIETSPSRYNKPNISPVASTFRNQQPPPNQFVFPSLSTDECPRTSESSKLAWTIFVVLICVSILNVVLFLHLVLVKAGDTPDRADAWLNSLNIDDTTNFTSEEWIRIFETREYLHHQKMNALKNSLIGSINSLKETEYYLLKMVRILSAPKPRPTFNDDENDTSSSPEEESEMLQLSTSTAIPMSEEL